MCNVCIYKKSNTTFIKISYILLVRKRPGVFTASMPNSVVFDFQIFANVLLIEDNKEQHVLCWNNRRIQCWTCACAASPLYLHSPPLCGRKSSVTSSRLGAAAQWESCPNWSRAKAHSEQLLASDALPRLINLKRPVFLCLLSTIRF